MVSKPNHVISKDVKMYLLLLYQIRDIDSMSREMPWPQTGATQIGLPDKVRAIKVLVVCYDRGYDLCWGWFLEPAQGAWI